MRCRRPIALTVLAATLSVSSSAIAQHHELGKVSFPTSCTAAVQADFETGVAMLHSYWFNYAGKQFRAVLDKDPGCAMAYWGIALDLLGNTLSSPPPAQSARAAWDLLEKARGVEVKTERERLWLDAIRAYFRNHDTVPVEQRLTAYNDAMRQLAERFPEDFEAQVYYALTLQASAPKSDMTYTNQYKSAAMLERLYAQQPQHPGITHYLIHAYDFAPFADKGIPAARRYALDRAGGAARAAHAGAHLLDGRPVAGLDHLESVGVGDSAGLLPRGGLHGVCAPATGAGRHRGEDDREGAGDSRTRRPSAQHGELHGEGVDAGALRARTRGLESGRGAADHADRVPAGGFADALHPRLRPGAARRSRRRQARDRRDAAPSRRDGEVRRLVLGRPDRRIRSSRCRRGSR